MAGDDCMPISSPPQQQGKSSEVQFDFYKRDKNACQFFSLYFFNFLAIRSCIPIKCHLSGQQQRAPILIP
jgi:hypothetical protein